MYTITKVSEQDGILDIQVSNGPVIYDVGIIDKGNYFEVIKGGNILVASKSDNQTDTIYDKLNIVIEKDGNDVTITNVTGDTTKITVMSDMNLDLLSEYGLLVSICNFKQTNWVEAFGLFGLNEDNSNVAAGYMNLITHLYGNELPSGTLKLTDHGEPTVDDAIVMQLNNFKDGPRKLIWQSTV